MAPMGTPADKYGLLLHGDRERRHRCDTLTFRCLCRLGSRWRLFSHICSGRRDSKPRCTTVEAAGSLQPAPPFLSSSSSSSTGLSTTCSTLPLLVLLLLHRALYNLLHPLLVLLLLLHRALYNLLHPPSPTSSMTSSNS
ncbi:unnamed protein product [Boreogadus saida]